MRVLLIKDKLLWNNRYYQKYKNTYCVLFNLEMYNSALKKEPFFGFFIFTHVNCVFFFSESKYRCGQD